MEKTKHKLKFERFEFKYIMPRTLRDEFESALGYFMEFDPFVEHTERHRYFVRSLYFDDPLYTCFNNKVDGVKTRAKFRIRTYTDIPAADVMQFLEIKGRYNQFVFKRRMPISTIEGPVCQHILNLKETDKVSEQFTFEYYRRKLAPVALVDYWRRPYFSKYDPDFRLTFDEQLTATQAVSLEPKASDRKRRILPGHTVMEVKFKRQIPAWFHRLVESYELRSRPCSKICKAMEALGLVEDI